MWNRNRSTNRLPFFEIPFFQLPWADYEDNIYAIMYKLGQGSHPPYPEKLVDEEASCFLDMCFKFNPDERATTGQLLAHPFVKVSLTVR